MRGPSSGRSDERDFSRERRSAQSLQRVSPRPRLSPRVPEPPPPNSLQARGLEEAAAVAGDDADVEPVALALEGERNVDAGLSERPDRSVEFGKRGDGFARDRMHDIPDVEVGLLRRAPPREADDDDLVGFVLPCIQPKP